MLKKINAPVLLGSLLLAIIFFGAGCGKSATTSPVTGAGTAFDSAPPELKTQWTSGIANTANGHYEAAFQNLSALFTNIQKLDETQSNALMQAWDDLGYRAFKAGDNGDESAVKVVKEMRDSGFGKNSGQR